MDGLAAGIGQGLAAIATIDRIAACFTGSLLGTAVGVLPGLGPTATIAILLPVTFAMEPLSAILMLCGIYYGVMYGGSITSVLMRVPGEVTSLMTCQDGYLIARQGRPGYALAICALASFAAGIVSTGLVAAIGEPLARISGAFGPPEYTMLMVGGLLLVSVVSQSSLRKSLILAALGLAMSTMGTDLVFGVERFTGGFLFMADGINVAIVAMGIYGVSEAVNALSAKDATLPLLPTRLAGLYPRPRELAAIAPATARGTILGFLIGLLPGAGATLSAFVAYGFEKSLDRNGTVGKGDPRAVAAPEAANNAASQAAMVPLLSLGIPNNVITSMILGAFVIHGLAPGPMLAATRPDLFWGVIAGMLVANFFLVVLNLPLVMVFVQLLRLDPKRLAIFVLVMCFVGAYSLRNQLGDCVLLAAFGFAGMVLRRWGYDAAPLVLSMVLGDLLEKSLQQALIMGYGSPAIFVQRPVSLAIIGATIAIVAALVVLRRSGRVRPDSGDP